MLYAFRKTRAQTIPPYLIVRDYIAKTKSIHNHKIDLHAINAQHTKAAYPLQDGQVLLVFDFHDAAQALAAVSLKACTTRENP